MNLIIDRSKWLRGEGVIPSKLVRTMDGKMCCLGFMGLACGVTREEMFNLSSPHQLSVSKALLFEGVVVNYEGNYLITLIGRGLFAANDSRIISEQERELQITRFFSSIGVEVSFIN